VPDSWAELLIARVNARLTHFFEDKRAQAERVSPRASELVDAVAALTLRGGKRVRALAIYAGYRAVAPEPPEETSPVFAALVELGASIELLQSYLLIQDDWMDDDDERRGGPSAHAAFRQTYADPKLAASLAILASDVAAGYAFELVLQTPFPAHTARTAQRVFLDTHLEVLAGQQLDLLGHESVGLIHHLKTGSYTVRGPIALGALLAGASAAQLATLERFGSPLGIAFQLRDDILGTFGDTRATGKPAGHDIREGKNTALISAAHELLRPEEREVLARAFGRADASAEAVQEATALLESRGARARVEARLSALLAEAREALANSDLQSAGIKLLFELSERVALRDR